jgi:anthranilate synthase component I
MEPIIAFKSLYVNTGRWQNRYMVDGLKEISKQRKAGAKVLTLSREMPLDEKDVLTLFKKLIEQYPGAHFLFQKNTERNGDFFPLHTFMGFDSFEKITVRQGRTFIERNGDGFEVKGSPLKVVAERLEKYKSSNQLVDYLFEIGAMGYIGYESVRFIEPILDGHAGSFKKLKENTDQTDIELNLFRKTIIIDHAQNKIFVISGAPTDEMQNDSDAEKILSSLDLIEGLIQNAVQKSANNLPKDIEMPIEDLESSMGRDRFIESVLQLKENIARGDIFQGVLSEQFEKEITFKPIDLFEVLRETSPSAYQYFYFTGEKSFLGASPEMLLSVRGKSLETHPIAGTRPRGKDLAEEKKYERQLTSSAKENAEHLMLVDLARNDLGRISKPGTVTIPEPCSIKKFPGVMHLVTRVLGQLKEDKNSLDALGSCFPAGTLSGAPKIRAMQLISELENKPRGFYGGAVILASFTGDLDSCIAIRSAEIKGNRVIFRAGAGIVADSRPQFEYEEILHKTKTLRKAIATAEKVFGSSRGKS